MIVYAATDFKLVVHNILFRGFLKFYSCNFDCWGKILALVGGMNLLGFPHSFE